ncbi:MAG TPA: mycofactocin-coupled SDR family oxidoreductase [Amycolatopsis sp.]|nr:mycofactocin-coupled SDR family oxidoreductase [Amycolatopsis sp.]
MGRVDGKVALVTGAARGQGRSHALRLAEEGADIIAVDVGESIPGVPYPGATKADFDETVERIRALGVAVRPHQADVRDLTALRHAVDDGVTAFGRLDIVVANAGIATFGHLVELDEQAWQLMIDINLTGVWKTIRAAVPPMIEAGNGGAVVITSSAATAVATEHIGHYTAAKSGLDGMMRVLAKELGPHRIRVNTINPGNVQTDMVYNSAMYRLFRPDLDAPTSADLENVCLDLTVLPVPVVQPSDISNAVLYLASEEGRYVTGTTHFVDAGEQVR